MTGAITGGTAVRSRSIYLDALRAVALTRVVVYHALSWKWITLASAMPLMFFIAGSLYAGSVDRRPVGRVIVDRYRRILLPYWVYAVAMLVLWGTLGVLDQLDVIDWVGFAFPLLSPNGPQGPGAGTDLELTWIALWYLQFHLFLSLIGGLLRRAQQRRPVVTWSVIGALFFGGIIVGSGIVVIVFYTACWVAGYHQHDGQLDAPVRRHGWLICILSGPMGLALGLAFEGSATTSLMAARGAAIGAALLGVFWLTFALAIRPVAEPWLSRWHLPAIIHWFSQRSLSIYLWHMVAIYAALTWALPGTSSPFMVLVWCIPLTLVAVVAVGWVEDVAAKRRPSLWPLLPAARPRGRTSAGA